MFDEGFGRAKMLYFSLRFSRTKILSEYSFDEKLKMKTIENKTKTEAR